MEPSRYVPRYYPPMCNMKEHNELQQRLATVEAERDRLKAENERLRSALENIANTWPLDGENAHLMRDEAKQALEVDGGKD